MATAIGSQMLGWLESAKKKKDEVLTDDVKTKINTGL